MVLGTPLKRGAGFDVTVNVALPETRRTDGAAERLVVTDPFWRVPVAAVAGGGGALTLQWRVVNGAWQSVTTEGVCELAELEPGEHQLEFAATEEGYWVDNRPLKIVVNYHPDYSALVATRFELLRSSEHEVAARAARELVRLGERAEAELQERMIRAEREAQLLPYMRQILQRIAEEHDEDRDKELDEDRDVVILRPAYSVEEYSFVLRRRQRDALQGAPRAACAIPGASAGLGGTPLPPQLGRPAKTGTPAGPCRSQFTTPSRLCTPTASHYSCRSVSIRGSCHEDFSFTYCCRREWSSASLISTMPNSRAR